MGGVVSTVGAGLAGKAAGDLVGGVFGDLTGAAGAEAAGRAAQAQERAARENLAFAKQTQDRALAQADSPEEFAALESALGRQQTAVDKQAQLFASLDPAILEASGQALKLLRGEEAKSLSPLRAQRDRQRQALLNQLRENLGPGAETSTAGIQALNQFDLETSETLQGAQQQSLGQLFGMGSAGAQGRGALNQSIGGIAQIGQGFGNIAQRKAGAITGTSPFVAQAGQGVASSAGSQFTESALKSQGKQQLFGQLLGATAQAGGAAIGASGAG